MFNCQSICNKRKIIDIKEYENKTDEMKRVKINNNKKKSITRKNKRRIYEIKNYKNETVQSNNNINEIHDNRKTNVKLLFLNDESDINFDSDGMTLNNYEYKSDTVKNVYAPIKCNDLKEIEKDKLQLDLIQDENINYTNKVNNNDIIY